MIYKHLTTDEKNILKKVLQIKSGFVVLHHQISSTKNNNIMKFKFTKDGQSISKAEFERNVPTDWVNQLDEFGCFSWGYFRATLID